MAEKYAIDANILIVAYRSIYPFTIAPSFWKQLVEKGGSNIDSPVKS